MRETSLRHLQWLTNEDLHSRYSRILLDTKEFTESTLLFCYHATKGIIKNSKKLFSPSREKLKNTATLVCNELWAALVLSNLYTIGSFQRPVNTEMDCAPANKRPLIMVHGVWHNSSAFFLFKRRLKKLGWNHVFHIDLQTARFSIPELAEQLKEFINDLCNETGYKTVDLVAHSLGGIVSRYYIQEIGGEERVKNLVTLGTPHNGTALSFLGLHDSIRELRPNGRFMKQLNSTKLPAGVKYTSIWSPFDFMIIPSENARILSSQAADSSDVQNIEADLVGHGGLLVSKDILRKIISILQ